MTKKVENPRFPNNIRAVREKVGLKLNRLAEQIGMTPGNLSRIERGDVNVTSDVLQRISKALEVAPGVLLDSADQHKLTEIKTTVDSKLLEDCVAMIMDVSEELKITPSPQEVAQWSSYLYAEANSSKKNVGSLREALAGVIKFSVQKRA